MHRTERDARGVARITSGDAWRVIAAEAVAHDRDLPRVLRTLDEDLWGLKLDGQRSEIGLLYGLISKVRSMLLLKELLREGWIKPETDFTRFKAQLERIPAERMPADKRYNPLATNPYVLFKALPQVRRYTSAELVRAMEVLLECNQRLVTSGLEEAFVLQRALVEIVGPGTPRSAASRASARAAPAPRGSS